MHKRRVSQASLRGEEPVNVCEVCFEAFGRHKVKVPSRVSLANWLWGGRHEPMFRRANLGHQLLLPLGRVVSTKVYLSSKGVDETAKQPSTSWRQRSLQTGISGTAILFGNGNISQAMQSFPPSQDTLQDTFVAVFTGPENPTDE